MARFVLVASFDTDNSDTRVQVRPRHREYLAELHEKGKVPESGPWADDTGALVVYEAADEAEVRDLFDADPFTEAGVWNVVSLKEWNRVFGA